MSRSNNEIASVYSAYSPTANFTVGGDSFESLEIRKGTQKGFYYFYNTKTHQIIKRFILHTSVSGIMTMAAVTFIEKDGSYTPRIELSKRKKDQEIDKETVVIDGATKSISARVELGEANHNFWELIEYIQSIKAVDIPRSGWSAIPAKKKAVLDSIEVDNDFVQKVLFSFSTPKARQLLIDAKKDDVNNLFASVKQAKNKKALVELDRLTVDGASEIELEKWIKDNDWVFGIEYIRRLDGTRIGIHADTDLLVESLDGYVDLIELKKASSHPLFIEDPSHPGSYYPSAKLSLVIGQTIHYLAVMDDMRLILKSEDELNVLKPRAKIVIGLSSKLKNEEKDALRHLNNTLHGIEILTYDEIKSRAKRLVSHYETKEK